MAGHSKWKNIQNRKAKQDSKREKVFNKLLRGIVTAAKINPNVEMNASLRLAISKALDFNMSRDTINKTIASVSGQLTGPDVMNIVYEGYGNFSISYMVVTITDNKNRTVSEVRHAFDKYGSAMASEGAVAYLFDFCSWVAVHGSISESDLEILLSYIDDIREFEYRAILICNVEKLGEIRQILLDKKYEIISSETGYLAKNFIKVTSEEMLEAHYRLLDALSDLNDVQEVFHNLDIIDE